MLPRFNSVCWQGVARQPLTFFASPKKVSKERRHNRPVHRAAYKQLRNRWLKACFANPHQSPLEFPFVQDRSVKIKTYMHQDCVRMIAFLIPTLSCIYKCLSLQGVGGGVELSASKSPMMCNRKWQKKVLCLSVASFNTFPFFVVQHWEPEGRFSAVAFFGLPFLARQKR